MASERKATAIYGAVFDRLMALRVELSLRPVSGNALDDAIARAMDEAASAAVAAYRTPVRVRAASPAGLTPTATHTDGGTTR